MAEGKELQKKPDAEEEGEEQKEGKLRWLVGWVVIPGGLLGALFLAGVHIGANYPDMWFSRLIGWLGG